MTTNADGGPAFPVPQQFDEQGMTLRDYFAAKAMQAGLTGATLPGLADGDPETVELLRKAVRIFWIVADEMVAARDK